MTLTFGNARTAVHEASHSVVAVVRELALVHASLRADLVERSLGHVRMHNLQPVSVANYCIMLLAGGEGERHAFGCVGGGDSQDVAIAREGLALALGVPISDPQVDEALAVCREAARADIEEHWTWILNVAAALRRQRWLDAAAIESLRPTENKRALQVPDTNRKESVPC